MDQLTREAVHRAYTALEIAQAPVRQPFSPAAMIRGMLDHSWGKKATVEYTIVAGLNQQYGVPDRNGNRVPGDVLMRDLTVNPATAGGYLASTRLDGYIPSLQPASWALQLGGQVVNVPPSGGVAFPRGTAAVTTQWLSTETSTITPSQPTLGQLAGTPKILSAFTKISRQLLQQSNVDDVIRVEMRNAAGAALDKAIIAGSGASGQPLGIVGTPGVGGFTGASLNQAALRNAQRDVGDANAVLNRSSLGYVTTPAVAELLATRQRFTGSSNVLWEGASADGTVEGVRAVSTTGCPAASMIFGDFSQVTVAQWSDGLVLELDPYTDFKSGVVSIRLLFAVDIAVVPQAFSVASSIT
jgi:HK97 family phage major capsid protein